MHCCLHTPLRYQLINDTYQFVLKESGELELNIFSFQIARLRNEVYSIKSSKSATG
jgi:hypothetical protein